MLLAAFAGSAMLRAWGTAIGLFLMIVIVIIISVYLVNDKGGAHGICETKKDMKPEAAKSLLAEVGRMHRAGPTTTPGPSRRRATT